MPRIILHPTSRHPLVLILLAYLIVTSLSMLLGAPRPGSINESLPRWGVNLWATGLGVGPALILWGLKLQPKLGRTSVNGALLEQVGMAILAAAGSLYAMAAFVAIGWSAMLPAGLLLGLSVACAYRWWVIRRQIKAYLDRKARETQGDDRR